MTTKSREYLFGPTVRAAAERAANARKEADKLACLIAPLRSHDLALASDTLGGGRKWHDFGDRL